MQFWEVDPGKAAAIVAGVTLFFLTAVVVSFFRAGGISGLRKRVVQNQSKAVVELDGKLGVVMTTADGQHRARNFTDAVALATEMTLQLRAVERSARWGTALGIVVVAITALVGVCYVLKGDGAQRALNVVAVAWFVAVIWLVWVLIPVLRLLWHGEDEQPLPPPTPPPTLTENPIGSVIEREDAATVDRQD